ncbi:M10 family metallopeptidase C-terminal domain-containing protein [Pseudomonas aeruginosa]|uniref:M10 family metallopeptidase C-terminal domain-containing protein n=1 Tax=Pseudomonas aeruginosa TaxID=287 RepID=UPI003FD21720
MSISTANKLIDLLANENKRGSGKEANGVKSKTVDEAAAALTRDSKGWGAIKKTPAGETVELTYKFSTGDGKNVVQLNSDAQALYKLQLARIADVANVEFTEHVGNGRGDLNVQITPNRGNNGGSSYPSANGAGTDYKYQEKITSSSHGQNVYIHEIGHSLGLAHPGNYNFGGPAASRTYLEDSLDYSIMSYNGGESKVASYGLQIDDIAALQALYGVNETTRDDNSIYGFNSNTNDTQFHIAKGKVKLDVPFTIWDGGGKDTLDFSGFAQDQRIDLHDGALSDVGGMKNGVGIANNAIIENVVSGSGKDVIIGNDFANDIKGGAGDDVIYGAGEADFLSGGSGSDIFVYRDISDSTLNASDRILDFTSGQDKIDITEILRSIGGGVELKFGDAFTGQIGDSVLSYNSSNNETVLAIDFSGQGVADINVEIVGRVEVSDILA